MFLFTATIATAEHRYNMEAQSLQDALAVSRWDQRQRTEDWMARKQAMKKISPE